MRESKLKTKEGNELLTWQRDLLSAFTRLAFAICDKEKGNNWECFALERSFLRVIEKFALYLIDSLGIRSAQGIFPDDGHVHHWCLRHIKANLI